MRAALVMGFAALAAIGCKDPGSKVTPAAVQAPGEAEKGTAPGDDTDRARGTVLAIDPSNSKIEFVGAKVTRSHQGGFTDFAGKLELSEPLEDSRVEVTIQTASLYSDEEKLTKHLKSADFFDVEKIPTATFRSTEITKSGEGHTITGDLTLHGVTKRITFPASVTVGEGTVKATAEFSINRHDFGITYPGMPDDLIRDLVVIKLTLDVPRQG
jgi:polyisoprenoid-binding protein YceI